MIHQSRNSLYQNCLTTENQNFHLEGASPWNWLRRTWARLLAWMLLHGQLHI